MYCENCGHKVPNNADFCPNCGHNIKHYHSIFFISLNLKSKWNRFSNRKKAISLMAIVFIGLIIFNGAFGFLAPHEDESYVEDYNTYYYDDLDTDESESYTTLIDEETYDDSSDSVSSSSSSSDYSDTQEDSNSYESGGSYVGSVNSDKFHYPSCGQAQKIKSGNLVTFSSRDEALSRGYSPCSFCSP